MNTDIKAVVPSVFIRVHLWPNFVFGLCPVICRYDRDATETGSHPAVARRVSGNVGLGAVRAAVRVGAYTAGTHEGAGLADQWLRVLRGYAYQGCAGTRRDRAAALCGRGLAGSSVLHRAGAR